MKRLKLVLFSIFTFTIFITANTQDKGTLLDEIIAVVGDEIVLKSDLEARLSEMKDQGVEVTNELEGVVLEELLYQKLLINQAKIDSIEVTEDEVNQQLQQRIDYYIKQFPSEAEFEKFYGKSAAQLKEDFRQDVSDLILTQKMQGEITKNLRITPADINDFYTSMPKDSLPLVGAEVQYAQIVMKPKVTKEQVEQTKKKLNELRDKLIASPFLWSFTAIQETEDKGSLQGKNAGCYERVERGVMVPEFEQAVLNLELGQVTEPFETDFGWHIARLDKKNGKFYDVCHILKYVEISSEDVLESQYKLDTLRESIIKQDTLTFKMAATKYSQDKDTRAAGGVVPNPYTGGTKHEVSQLDPQITLALNQLKPGDISTPIKMEDQTGGTDYRIFFLEERYAAHAASIDTDYALLKRMAENDAQNKALEEWIQKKILDTYCRLNNQFEDYAFRYNWTSN